ncbi:thiamine ABC transporter substrate-binding protein [Oerskovia turbata]|uniref:Thiamine ABC transporter substrate-binding protein n=1 Tax=Oerskovia turbata TaxID=1713 RepID=A0A4Q1KTL6_9CELL|nr:thiamine ABC transporter substrate-binding protein [Oerskovia turbata]RXR25300.1 thiamine ABC transporter substrate-binding protein [Oerskovia turbata]RXR32759.1 thiamine ABC transporter substrate-binding protein [Oerskovia turbata]TGJ95564.1 thiamine ABC transporter substrate-binding protein [Actinotalea fermentans ATCC 43279 = JCM 9966 = DSM 3133]
MNTISTRRSTPRRLGLGLVGGIGALALAACAGTTDAGSGTASDQDTVTLVTHDSFAVSDDVLATFEAESGLTVKQVAPGDGGALVNQLVLTKDSPLGDVVFGIDNSFATRAIDEGVLAPYTPEGLADSAAQYAIGDGALTPIDVGDVCVNVDHAWFASAGIPEPVTLDDLTKPEYEDLLVVTNPATSSPGLSFLLATVGAYGEDGWEGYWAKLKDNGVKVVDGWSDAYSVDFSGGEGKGARPLALSYSTSPAFTVSEDGTSTSTGALLDTCFRQVEYAGVLAGAENPEGAKKLVDFLVSDAFQADVADNMYMYPANSDITLPEGWAQFAPLSPEPFEVAPADITAHRDEWIKAWTSTVIG